MKKMLHVILLSISLIVSLELLLSHDQTRAASIEGSVSLSILPSLSNCVYGTSINLGMHTGQYDAFSLTGVFSPSEFSCTDMDGLESWSMTLLASSDLSDGIHTISKDNVFLSADPNQVVAGLCSTGSNTTSFTSIGKTPGTILHKQSFSGHICIISTSNVMLSVHIPPNQAVGSYAGSLTLTSPR